MRRSVLSYFGVALATVLVGCWGHSLPESDTTGAEREASTGKPRLQSATEPSPTFSHVLAVEAVYYTTGPQQGRPPDGKLPSGTRVHIVRQAGSYTLVRTDGGIEAYVAADIVKTSTEREHNQPK